MAAFVKSVEIFTTTFTAASSLLTNTVNLTKSQDETKCVPFYVMRFTSEATSDDAKTKFGVSIEMIDNSGTPAARVRWRGVGASGNVTVEVTIVEFGANVTIQQNSTAVSLTGTSVTDSITAVADVDNAFIVFTQHGAASDNADDFDDFCIQARFNSTIEIQFERRASGAPDWEIYWYVVESDGTDFLTEYVDDDFGATEAGPTAITLTNSVTLANAFIVCTYESGHPTDDMEEGSCNMALTGTTTLTWYRDHGDVLADGAGTIGVWVVRASATEFDVQRFATDVDGQLTTSQSITEIDEARTIVLPSQHVGFGSAWMINSSAGSTRTDNYRTDAIITSTTNVDLVRLADTSVIGNNNNYRFEVIEFELESAAAALVPMLPLLGVG